MDKPVRILVVDDDDAVRSAVVNMLTRLGYATLEASNSLDAERIFREAEPAIDFSVVDVNLGVEGAVGSNQFVSLLPSNGYIRLTGESLSSIPPDKRGFAVVQKPVSPLRLKQIIEDGLAVNRAEERDAPGGGDLGRGRESGRGPELPFGP